MQADRRSAVIVELVCTVSSRQNGSARIGVRAACDNLSQSLAL